MDVPFIRCTNLFISADKIGNMYILVIPEWIQVFKLIFISLTDRYLNLKRSTVAIKYLRALDLNFLNCYQLFRSIMVFMELVYMVMNWVANWLDKREACYLLKYNYGNARTT